MKIEKILKIMKFFSWFAFIGLTIKTGTILVTYFLSLNNNEVAKNLYEGINLYQYLNFSFTHYTFLVFYKIIIFSLEAYIAYLVIQLLRKLDTKQPFNLDVQSFMQQISKRIFYLWIIAIVHNTHMQVVGKKYSFEIELFSSDFVFLSVIIFIFAQILKQGIKIQTENELTI